MASQGPAETAGGVPFRHSDSQELGRVIVRSEFDRISGLGVWCVVKAVLRTKH